MIRPFISSLGSSTSRVVLSPACLAASRCIATERMLRARRSASCLVSASISCNLTPAWWRASCSTSASSSCLACEALRPEIRSSSRRWTRLARFSSSDCWLRLRSRSSSAWVRRSTSPRCTSSDSVSRRACSSIRAISARRATSSSCTGPAWLSRASPASLLDSSRLHGCNSARISIAMLLPGELIRLFARGAVFARRARNRQRRRHSMSAIALGRLGQARKPPAVESSWKSFDSRCQSLKQLVIRVFGRPTVATWIVDPRPPSGKPYPGYEGWRAARRIAS